MFPIPHEQIIKHDGVDSDKKLYFIRELYKIHIVEIVFKNEATEVYKNRSIDELIQDDAILITVLMYF